MFYHKGESVKSNNCKQYRRENIVSRNRGIMSNNDAQDSKSL